MEQVQKQSATQEIETLYANHSERVKSLRILVVDDHASSRMLMTHILGKAKHTPNLCKDPSRAIEVAKEKEYDLFILDVHMPAMSGGELLNYLRNSSPKYQNTPVILISADHAPSLQHLASQITNAVFVRKPISTEVLLDAIEKLINK